MAGGRVQAVYSPTVSPERLMQALPEELGDLAPLLAMTLGEQQDASMSGLVRLLERSLADPRRLRAILRFQAAALTYEGVTGEPGKFAFEPMAALPPMFQALPLQMSVAALVVEGSRRCGPAVDLDEWGGLAFVRQTVAGRKCRQGGPDKYGYQDPYNAGRHACAERACPPGRNGSGGSRHDGPRAGAGRPGRAAHAF